MRNVTLLVVSLLVFAVAEFVLITVRLMSYRDTKAPEKLADSFSYLGLLVVAFCVSGFIACKLSNQPLIVMLSVGLFCGAFGSVLISVWLYFRYLRN